MANPKGVLALVLLLAGVGCKTASTNPADMMGATGSSRWTDSVLASLSLREKAAQIVWPSVYGDYVSADSPQWRRLSDYIQKEKVGGFTISVGSPTEVAAKLNALQSMSQVPLLFGADLEAGAGFRRAGRLLRPQCDRSRWRDRLSSRNGRGAQLVTPRSLTSRGDSRRSKGARSESISRMRQCSTSTTILTIP